MASGFIFIERALFEHTMFRDDFERGVFARLVAQAAWKPTQIRYKDRVLTLERGQLATSIRDLATRSGMTRRRIERILNVFENGDTIRRETGTGITVITICNYDDYQAPIETNVTEAGQHTGHPRDTPVTQNNKYKTLKTLTSPNGEESVKPTLPSSDQIEIDLRQVILTPMADAWNTICGAAGLTRVREVKGQRRAKMLKRYREDFRSDIQRWQAYCRAIASSAFMTGDNDRGWKADIDWALEPRNLTKVREGKYDNKGGPTGDDTPRRHY